MREKPSYYAIIIADVRYDKKVTPNAKLLYGEITALCHEKGYCWANNQYFADLYGVSKKSISAWIKQLKDQEHIQVEMKYKPGGKEIEGRYLRLLGQGREDNFHTPPEEKVTDNTTVINNTINNVNWEILRDEFNRITGKKTKVVNDKARRQIRARLREGYSKEDLRNAIKNCYNDDHHQNTEHKYCTLEFISRPEKFERFATQQPTTNPQTETDEERSTRLLKQTKDTQ